MHLTTLHKVAAYAMPARPMQLQWVRGNGGRQRLQEDDWTALAQQGVSHRFLGDFRALDMFFSSATACLKPAAVEGGVPKKQPKNTPKSGQNNALRCHILTFS